MLVHITGASGSGTTTTGKALALELDCVFLDTDNYFWLPTEPPYRTKRPEAERSALLLSDIQQAGGVAVVSGSVSGWGAEVEDALDFVVFLYLDAPIRLERLRQREIARFGKVDPAFLEWASQYDAGPPEGRSLAKQRAWLAARSCPTLQLEGDLTTQARLNRIRDWMNDVRGDARFDDDSWSQNKATHPSPTRTTK